MANRFYPNVGRVWSGHVAPVTLDVTFTISNSDTAGLGIVAGSLKGPGILNVFAHTTQTPGVGNSTPGYPAPTNPNPAAGTLMVQLDGNYTAYRIGHYQFRTVATGTNVAVDSTSLTIGNPYTITVLGTSTAADWLALGLPFGVTATVGASFVALATGAGAGSGQVQAPVATGTKIDAIEVIGNPTMSAPQGVGATPGMWIILQCFYEGAVAAIPNGTVVSLDFLLNNSSVKG